MRPYGIIFFSVFAILLRPVPSRADPVSTLARDPAWLKLGHYEVGFFGGYVSQVNDPRFFLSPEGHRNPEKELQATIEAFTTPPTVSHPSAECNFPARYAWLKSRGLQIGSSGVDCSEQKAWREGIGARSATLVYSSAYPNNPASMFGHTLLRLNKSNGEPILNYGANFEARLESQDSALLFAFKGLFGLYRGEYTISPYYVKVNEYNFAESRDLWEYDLGLDEAEVDFLVSHLWELYVSGGFSYYFLTKNCSYQLLALLEAVKPNWRLTRGFRLYALPIDTVKRVHDEVGGVLAESWRPSLHSRMIAQVQRLDDDQARVRQEVLNGKKDPGEVNDASILESLITTMDYLRRKKVAGLTSGETARFSQVLRRRAEMGPSAEPPVEDVSQFSPLSTHGSGAFFGGMIYRGEEWAAMLGTRLALHDFVDAPGGFPPGFQVEVGKLKVSMAAKSARFSLRLEQAELFDLTSLYPANSGSMQFSWAFRAGGNRLLDFGRTDVFGFGIEGGPGIAFGFARNTRWVYGLLLARGELTPGTNRAGRYGPLGEIGANASLSRFLTFSGRIRRMSELGRPFQRSGYWESNVELGLKVSQDLQVRGGARVAGAEFFSKSPLSEWTSELRWYY